MKIALDPFMHRHLSLDELPFKVKELGYDWIELSPRGDFLEWFKAPRVFPDLARFGYLYLRGGRWAGGVQVVPEVWVAESITPSTALNSAYGFMWWLNQPGHWVLPSAPLRNEGDGQIAPEAPQELFAAIGAFGQFVVIDPTTESVWVRLGPTDLADATGVGKLDDLWSAFAAAQLP